MSETPEAVPAFKSTPIGEIKLTDSTTVKISTFEGRDGRKRVDIRLFLAGEKYTGPTRKGVTAAGEPPGAAEDTPDGKVTADISSFDIG